MTLWSVFQYPVTYTIVHNDNFMYIGAKRAGIAGEYVNGNTNTPIHFSNLQCTGNEGEIYQCMGDEQPTGCTHDNDVSVECLRK